MTRYLLASLAVGLLFIVLDVLINVNPLARRLNRALEPVARKTMNPLPAILIDLCYGFLIAGLYWLLHAAMPGPTLIARALSFGLMLWLLRVVMAALSQWVMFDLPAASPLYYIGAGLFEMLAIALACALILAPLG